MFSTNYDEIGNGSELLPEGRYEVIIKTAQLNATKNETPYIDVRMVIRNDVEQKYQNKYIFHSIWKKREPSPQDLNVDGYSFKQLMSLAKAAKLPSGKNYGSIEELCADFVGKCVIAEIEHKEDNSGKMRERVKFCYESAFPNCKHVFKEAAAPVSKDTYQKPKQDAFAQPTTAQGADFSDYEEVASDNKIPF